MAKILTWQQFDQMDSATRQALLEELGKNVLAKTAVFDQVSDMLAYHNQLPDLISLLTTGWTQLQRSSKANEWRQQAITALLTDSLIFQHLATQPPDASTDAPETLVQTLQRFISIDADGLNRYLAHLNGYTQYQWRLDHLTEHPPQNMAALLIEFLAYTHREAQLPYGRTNLLRQLLPTYFVERRTGQLTPRQDLGDLRRSGRPIFKPPASSHPLAPDSDTLQRFLAKLLNYDPIRPYPAAALFTLMPLWLNFLQTRQLLTATETADNLADLATLKPDLLAFWQSFAGDSSLATAVSHWPNQ